MIPTSLAPLASHLWQSTIFAAAAGLMALALRRNRAGVRYWLWIAASYKFLIPFSLLVCIGQWFHWRTAATRIAPVVVHFTDAVSGPLLLTAPSAPLLIAAPHPVSQVHNFATLLFLLLGGIWAFGFLLVAAVWTRQCIRIRTIIRSAKPAASELPIPVIFTTARVEPKVFGLFRPVLLVPEGIADRLTPAELNAVFEHELCHVRRRDNLTGVIHMFVEALFWFFPVVWWLGARIIDERERACDEAVLKNGEATAYAESILKVCKLYLEPSLTCVSGITGSDLKRRIERIMRGSFGEALSIRKKLLLTTAGVAVLALPVMAGVVGTSRLSQATPRARVIRNEPVIARVNNDFITLTQLDQARAKLLEDTLQDCRGCSDDQVQQKMAPQEKNLVRDLIDDSLLVQRGKDLGINVDAGVTRRLDEIRQQNGLTSMDDLQRTIEQQGPDFDDFKTQIANQLIEQEVIRREVGGKLTPDQKTDPVLRDYLNMLREKSYVQVVPGYEDTAATPGNIGAIEETPPTPNFAPKLAQAPSTQPPAAPSPAAQSTITLARDRQTAAEKVPEQVALREIFVGPGFLKELGRADAPNMSQADIAVLRKNANVLLQRVKDGQDFRDVARQYSWGPTNQQGGELGRFSRSDLSAELADIVFALPKNGVTEVLETYSQAGANADYHSLGYGGPYQDNYAFRFHLLDVLHSDPRALNHNGVNEVFLGFTILQVSEHDPAQ